MNKKYIKPAIIKIKVCKANVIATSGQLGVSSQNATINDGIVEMEGKSRDDDFFSDEDVDF